MLLTSVQLGQRASPLCKTVVQREHTSSFRAAMLEDQHCTHSIPARHAPAPGHVPPSHDARLKYILSSLPTPYSPYRCCKPKSARPMARTTLPSDESSPSEASDTEQKSSTVCFLCRQRKTKCDRAVPSCGFCLKAKVDCKYVPNLKKRGLRAGYVSQLESRLGMRDEPLICCF